MAANGETKMKFPVMILCKSLYTRKILNFILKVAISVIYIEVKVCI